MNRTPILALSLLIASSAAARTPKAVPPPVAPVVEEVAPAGAPDRARPAPLAPRPLVTPAAQRGTLSNGLEVIVVPNHEVPLFSLQLASRVGADVDPAGKEGLVSSTFAMLDRGAGKRTAADIAAAARALGGTVGAGAGSDGAAVGVSGPVAQLEGLLALWSDLVLRPTFPAEEWAVLQEQRISGLKARAEDPGAIAGRVRAHLTWGDQYKGRLVTEASYGAITTKDLKAMHKRAFGPSNSVVLVGGDVELDQVMPALEAVLAKWKTKPKLVPPKASVQALEAATIYVVDKPGAAQTVVSLALPVNDRTAADWHELDLANTMFGGAFTARVNMNLREDKGWTYGARCGVSAAMGPGIWSCSANIQADKTVEAVQELQRELADVSSGRPFTAEEFAFFQGYRIDALYGAYETPASLLGELETIWTYGLPSTWIDDEIPSLRAVTLPAAQAAWARWIHPDRASWLLVGDLASYRDALAATGLPIVELNRDGHPLP